MHRRNFLKIAGVSSLALASPSLSLSQSSSGLHVPLGFCDHSLWAFKLNATQLIEYTVAQKLDVLKINSLSVFESLEKDYLVKIRKLAESNKIKIHLSVGCICNDAEASSGNETLLKKGIQIAKTLDSPILGGFIGSRKDRYSDGGIKPKMEKLVKLLRSLRNEALEANIKFAVENHSGDLSTDEVLEIIQETGQDICGALYDPGNAIYALEDPIKALENLGKHIISTTVRDTMIWPTKDGATFQWVAPGDGLVDYKYFVKFLSEECPGIPINVETIANSPRQIPYLTSEFWDGYPDLAAHKLRDFLKLLRKGSPIEFLEVPSNMDKISFMRKLQEDLLLKSIHYLRHECGAGLIDD